MRENRDGNFHIVGGNKKIPFLQVKTISLLVPSSFVKVADHTLTLY